MKSKLGEGEGAGRRRCSKLGAELRRGWLLRADGGSAGACVRCAAATPALAARSWDAQPRGGGCKARGARSPLPSQREPRRPGKDGKDARAAASQAEELASPAARRRPLVPLSTAPGTWVSPKTPQSSACLQGSFRMEEELHHLRFTDGEGEGCRETWPSPGALLPSSPAGNPLHLQKQA